jgi:5-methylcytosine-specific restriction endonuclease McrA
LRAERPPTGDFPAAFRTIAEAKHLARRRWLEAAAPHVLDRYQDFDLARDRLELLPRLKWKKTAREALRHCYDGGGTGLAALKQAFLKDLSATARRRCPYCMTRRPGSIDHFLPLDHYPEFAVLATNWVYVCERCNRIKGAGLVDVIRSVLNPYFDDVPETEPLLYAEASIVGGSVSIEFEVPVPNNKLPRPELAEIAQRQVAELGALEDMRDEAVPFVTSTIGSIVTEAALALSREALSDRLQARRRNVPHDDINGWELAALEALELCPDLLELVNRRIALKQPSPPLRPPRDLGLVRRAAMIAARE